jgi:hypothetical protein
MLRADWSERLRPVTTMAFSLVPPAAAGFCGASAFCAGVAGLSCAVAAGFGSETGWSCAIAGDAAANIAVSMVVDQSTELTRRIKSPLQATMETHLLRTLYDAGSKSYKT